MTADSHHQKGFTLVELAIALTIIGLLIGGVIKGKQLIENARVTSTIVQVNGIEAAVTTFRDSYQFLPGDLAQASVRINNCGNCTPFAGDATGTPNDSIVGSNQWDAMTPQALTNATAATSVGQETILFWAELVQAGMIGGVTNDGISNTNAPTFGTSLPAARIGGGFLAGHATGGQLQAGVRPGIAGPLSMNGLILLLAPSPVAPVTGNTGEGVLTWSVAAQIDRKMDDFIPATGLVQSYGVAASCFGLAGPDTNSKDCGLIFSLQP